MIDAVHSDKFEHNLDWSGYFRICK